MMKFLKQMCKNKKGVTLVELMVSFTLTAIFMTAAVLVMSSFLKVYDRTNNVAQSTSVSDMLLETITSELSMASQGETESMKIRKGAHDIDTVDYQDKNGNTVHMSVKEGLLLLQYDAQKDIAESKPVDWGYTEKVYLNNKITKLTFTKGKGNVITIHMTLHNDRTGYSVNSQRVIECFNLSSPDITEVSGS